ncbi:MAG TPA: ABC transporter substrate-binding protein [Bdellovibrionota bacterium]|jgi:phospholipid transport system substrate-binding protein
MKVLFSLCLSFLVAPAFAGAAPKAVVEEIFAKAGMPEISSDSGKQKEVTAYVDFGALAKAALGKEFKKVSAQEFQWFRDTLQEIITRTVYPKAPDFLSGVKITYNAVEEKGAKAKVKSTVQNKADLTDVDYELAQKDGSWKVVDVAIAGQSWVESIRDQVAQVIKKKKWQGLKDSMSKRLNDIKAGKV